MKLYLFSAMHNVARVRAWPQSRASSVGRTKSSGPATCVLMTTTFASGGGQTRAPRLWANQCLYSTIAEGALFYLVQYPFVVVQSSLLREQSKSHKSIPHWSGDLASARPFTVNKSQRRWHSVINNSYGRWCYVLVQHFLP